MCGTFVVNSCGIFLWYFFVVLLCGTFWIAYAVVCVVNYCAILCSKFWWSKWWWTISTKTINNQQTQRREKYRMTIHWNSKKASSPLSMKILNIWSTPHKNIYIYILMHVIQMEKNLWTACLRISRKFWKVSHVPIVPVINRFTYISKYHESIAFEFQ